MSYKTKKQLVFHERQKHTKENLLACKECGKKYARPTELERHEETHKGQKDVCPHCGKMLVHKHTLKRHIQQHHSGQPRIRFECSVCEKTFTEKYTRDQHVLSHSGKTFSCSKCDKTYSNKNSLRKHLQRHEKRYQCGFCHKRFGTGFELKEHEQRRQRNLGCCPKIGLPATNGDDFLQESTTPCRICGAIRVVQNWSPTIRTEDISAYICNICKCSFEDLESMITHMDEHLK